MDLIDIIVEKFSKNLMKKNKSVGTSPNRSFSDKAAIMKEFQKDKILYHKEINRNLSNLMNGNTGIDDYLKAQKESIKLHFQKAYFLGKTFSQSVEKKLSSDEVKSIDYQVAKEMAFMRKFADDVLSRTGKMDYSRRMKMYSEGLVPIFIFGQMVYLPEDAQIKWVLGETDKHCVDCLSIAANSPYTKKTLPTVPKACDSACLSNCLCELHFKDIGPNDDYIYYLMKNHSTSGKNVPEPATVAALKEISSAFYFHRGNAHLNNDKDQMKTANDERARFNNMISESNLSIKAALPTTRFLKELDLFSNHPKFERIFSGEGNIGKIVSVHSNGKQIYGKAVGFGTGLLHVVDVSGEKYTFNLTSSIIFKER